MQKKHRTAVFIEAGGNKVFFANGVLDVLYRENIIFDKAAGFSSASPIILAYLLGLSNKALDIFAKKLNQNKKNFYFFEANHFPHNKIYKDSVSELIEGHPLKDIESDFVIYASQTSASWSKLKGSLASVILLLRFGFRINLLKYFGKAFFIKSATLTKESLLSKREVLDFIIGSSTIYPFINLYYVKGVLILDGALLDLDYKQVLSDAQKKVIIHTEQGETKQIGDIFHIYADKPVPSNVLDYTDGSKIIELHKLGQTVMEDTLPLLMRFLNTE